jgi:hypothetical protein
MVERPGDVLRMNPAEPVKQTGFGRLDATLRKIPGLGILLVWVLFEHWGSGPHANGWMVFALVCAVSVALFEEYLEPRVDKWLTATPAPGTPSQPSA